MQIGDAAVKVAGGPALTVTLTVLVTLAHGAFEAVNVKVLVPALFHETVCGPCPDGVPGVQPSQLHAYPCPVTGVLTVSVELTPVQSTEGEAVKAGLG